MSKIKNIEIDHKILAKHFSMNIEGFRQLKKRYKEGQGRIWTVYVKAYNFDTGVLNDSC